MGRVERCPQASYQWRDIHSVAREPYPMRCYLRAVSIFDGPVLTIHVGRSSRRCKTVRDSLPEPDSFRIKHRDALIDFIGETVRRGCGPRAEKAAALAAELVPAEVRTVPLFGFRRDGAAARG
jgi:hypothetical protein